MSRRSIVHSLWIGAPLSRLQRLALQSFVANGHEFHLHAYRRLEVPRGVILKDAASILEKSAVYRHASGSLAPFADVFRYKLLHDQGGWWVDMDVICLKPLDFDRDLVFGWQSEEEVNNAVLYAERRSPHMKILYSLARRIPADAPWASTGPRLLTAVARTLNALDRAEPIEAFYPIGCGDFLELLRPHREIPPRSYTIHLWHTVFQRTAIPGHASYSRTSILGQLQERYGV